MAVSKMRAEAMAKMNPEMKDYVDGLVDLARQEFGLTGVPFTEVIAVIDKAYAYTAIPFVNGKGTPEEVRSAAGENNGSAKVFGFARLHGLGADEALRLFCEHYESVVATPEGSDHGNIRAFIKHGWDKLEFDDGGDAATKPLRLRVPGEVDDADI